MKTFPKVPGKRPGDGSRALFFSEMRKCFPLVNVCTKNVFVDTDGERDRLLYKSSKCTRND